MEAYEKIIESFHKVKKFNSEYMTSQEGYKEIPVSRQLAIN